MANETRVAWEPLKEFTAEVFTKMGMPPQDAETEASVLSWANRRGVDSHGVGLIPTYMEWIDREVMNPRPDIQVLKETPATIFVEADRAFGPVAHRSITTQRRSGTRFRWPREVQPGGISLK